MIAVSSITYAYKAQTLLRRNGIASHIVRTPKSVTGCGYSLVVHGNVEKAIALLQEAEIKIVSVS